MSSERPNFMDGIEKRVISCLREGFSREFSLSVPAETLGLRPTPKGFEGTHTLVLFPFAKTLRKAPRDVGERLGKLLLEQVDALASYAVVGGFLNLTLKDAYWLERWRSACQEGNFGLFPPKKESILIEFCSPNTNKPLHLGHLRNIFLGDAVASILEAVGHEVTRCCLYNDRGVHICKSMVAYEKYGHGETPETKKAKGDHLVGEYYSLFERKYREEIQALVSAGASEEEANKRSSLMRAIQEMLKKWEHNDPAVRTQWERMNGWAYAGFQKSYKRLGLRFDKLYYESDTYLLGKALVEEGVKNGFFYREEDGAVWVDLSQQGLGKKLLLRADGTSVYMTQDLGTAEQKQRDFSAHRSLYVLGDEQRYHFAVLLEVLRLLRRDYAKDTQHLSYGMVDLPTGKMKSREGTVIEADDLIDELEQMAEKVTRVLSSKKEEEVAHPPALYRQLALGAIKFFLLKIHAKKRVVFHAGRSVDLQGVTGTFIQYTHARITSLLKKAKGLIPAYQASSCHDEERAVMQHVLAYPTRLQEAADHYEPALLAEYLYELAKAYNRLYAAWPVLKEANESHRRFRMGIAVMTKKVIAQGMKCLGIEVPDSM